MGMGHEAWGMGRHRLEHGQHRPAHMRKQRLWHMKQYKRRHMGQQTLRDGAADRSSRLTSSEALHSTKPHGRRAQACLEGARASVESK